MSSEEVPNATQSMGSDTTIREGIYLIANRSTRMQLDLPFASEKEGACVDAWFYKSGGFIQQNWLISPTEDQSFVLRNIGSGNVLDFAGNGEVGKHLVCKSRVEGLERQQWRLEFEETGFFCIRNAQFFQMVLGVHPWGGVPTETLDVVSGRHIRGDHNQQWVVERRSLDVSEVRDVVDACPIMEEIRVAWPRPNIRGMIVIKDNWRDSLMKESGLRCQLPRPGLLDHTAFAMKLKETVQSNCARYMKIDGYAILFGVVGGSANVGSEAYNWHLTDDLCEVVFLDPLNGREITAKGLQKKGFRAEWAIC